MNVPPGRDNGTPATLPLHSQEVSPRVAALMQCMRQLRELLVRMNDEQYARKPVGHFKSSVGGHVRHSLDHVRALIACRETGLLNYDERERDTDVEYRRAAAIVELQNVERELGRLSEAALQRPLMLRAMLTADGVSIEAATSFGRELAFVVSHTIHHNALITAMLHLLGVSPPDNFGLAPSTIAHLHEAACAPSPSSL